MFFARKQQAGDRSINGDWKKVQKLRPHPLHLVQSLACLLSTGDQAIVGFSGKERCLSLGETG